jgi:hypothetical protein
VFKNLQKKTFLIIFFQLPGEQTKASQAREGCV